jgi:hypothetical protein
VVKCVCYRVPLPDEDDEEAEDLEKDDDEKKKLSANTGSPHQVLCSQICLGLGLRQIC